MLEACKQLYHYVEFAKHHIQTVTNHENLRKFSIDNSFTPKKLDIWKQKFWRNLRIECNTLVVS